ncbi:hypothetical protein [Actinacidiphila bryophytorum]|uniref:hypothetical protein n=1 Tax=Actinacidiphila bryophytorum TaxID=1436133 RepID=UPI002176BF89|nr:hypothetical protein [Actinacidiphila bryophytorum]UWE07452.1 hypothetical protein NYE86_01025 [Actinacidiphila bryophytorum]
MATSLYHVRKTSLGLRRKYRISADDGKGKPGEQIGYAEKQLKVSDALDIYRDEQRTEKLVSVRESSKGWLAALTGYEAFDGDGRLLGAFGVLPKKSVQRTTWEFEQPGLGRLTGTERSVSTARARRLLTLLDTAGEIAGALVKYHFDFTLDGEPAFSIDKPKVLDDWYRLTVHDDALDRQLLFALTVTMEARQRG